MSRGIGGTVLGGARLGAVALTAATLLLATAAPATAIAASTPRIGLVYQRAAQDDPERNVIAVAAANGTGARQILAGVEGDLTHPDWSPDGRRISFVVDTLTIMQSSATGASPRPIVTCGDGCIGIDYPAWSPDGRSIAYTRYTGTPRFGPPESSEIVVRRLRTGAERVVARSVKGRLVDVPRWSPDGRRLVVGIDRFDADFFETGSAIAIVDVRAASLCRIVPFESYAYAPDWNHRTGEIVFSKETARYAATPPDGPLDLYGIRPDGSGLRRITHLTDDRVAFQPAFTPDSRSLVATLDEPGARVGVRVSLADGSVRRLLPGTHLKVRPS